MDTKEEYSSDSSYDSGEDDNELAMAFMMATEEDAKTFKSAPTAKASGKIKISGRGIGKSQKKKTLFTSCYTDASASNENDESKDEDNGGAMSFGVVEDEVVTKQSAAREPEELDWRQAAKDRAEQTYKDKGGHKKIREGGSDTPFNFNEVKVDAPTQQHAGNDGGNDFDAFMNGKKGWGGWWDGLMCGWC